MWPTKDIEICQWSETYFLFFSDNIWGDFIYYSHFLPALATLLVTLFLFINARKNKAAQALLFTGISFTVWCLMDQFLWATDSIEHIMFIWSAMIYFELFIYVGILYFIYSFISGKFPDFKQELIIFALFIPLFIFGHTPLNLTAFDLTNCWREAIEGPLWTNYIYLVEIIIAFWISLFALKALRNEKQTDRKREVILVVSGAILFLLFFSAGNILGSLESDWEVGQIGLFGMPIMLVFISYVVVRYQSFQAKVFAAEAIFSAAFLLLLSILFVRTIENAHTIAISTLVLFSILGMLLVKSIKKEIKQREQIQDLVYKLEHANDRLKQIDKLKSEFVSIASHQLRSPLTSIMGYASLLREGHYGNITTKQREPVERIEESARLMSSSIEDYLNVSSIESGNMKYQKTDFNLRTEVEQVCDDLRPEGIKRGLLIHFKPKLDSQGVVNADRNKVLQIIHNLINNALKYTPHGTITVLLHDDVKKKRIFLEVTDTGIGMDSATLHSIFQKFERGDRANTLNIKGTGLGLYVAQRMAEAMGGTITASSAGEGKGSTFTLELPLAL